MRELLEVFSAGSGGSVMVLGIGNRLRGDDGVGSLLAERLVRRGKAGVFDCGEVPENYTGRVKERVPRAVVFVDAMELGSEPGTVAILAGQDLSDAKRPSTHNPTLGPLALYLGQETGAEVFLLGIQPKRTGFGEPMSDEVERTLGVLEDALAACLQDGNAGTLVKEE